VQVGVTVLAVYAIATTAGISTVPAVFLGFVVSLSSTAIVLKLLQTRLEMEAPHGRVVLAILIFQDLIVVPMMLITPLMAGNGGNVWEEMGWMLAKMAAVLGAVIVGARYVMPRVLYAVARTRSRELFLLTIVGTCLGVAWLTSLAGLSLALGAFMAGLIISESEYSYEAVSNVMPFREIFASFFFVSVGMLLDVNFLLAHPLTILLVALGVMVLKFGIAGLAARVLSLPFRTVVLVGMALAQVGEFAFILSKTGIDAGVMDATTYQYFLAVSLFTMACTPFLMMLGTPLANALSRTPLPGGLRQRLSGSGQQEVLAPEHEARLHDHLVVIGFGLNGRNLVKAAQYAHIPYVIIEHNAATVRQERLNGLPIIYGDAAQEHVLEHCHAADARVIVVAISDPPSTRRIVSTLRHIAPAASIIVRTRYLKETDELRRLGASEVIPEELETSVEIFSRVLAKYLVPLHDIQHFVGEMRQDSYGMLRASSLNPKEWSQINLPIADAELTTMEIGVSCRLAHHTLAQLQLRQHYSVNLVALRRQGKMFYELGPDTELVVGDVLYLFGHHEAIHRFVAQHAWVGVA
jgi:CPA2 family monovalent cation:H+ antiporter-2